MSTELLLVRHAQTEWSVSGKHTGRTDIPLTDEGRAHAERLRSVLAPLAPALVLSSPLRRARDTAELAGLRDVQLRDDLLEWDYGAYEGLRSAEIRFSRPGWWLWRDGVPEGEQAADVAARVDRVIEEVLQVDGLVIAVAHGHVLRALAARWVEQPPVFGGRLPLGTGAICRLGFEHGVRSLWEWNGHIA